MDPISKKHLNPLDFGPQNTALPGKIDHHPSFDRTKLIERYNNITQYLDLQNYMFFDSIMERTSKEGIMELYDGVMFLIILFITVLLIFITSDSYNSKAMTEHNQSRVQFFNSESSFGSSTSFSNSRVQFINDELITDTEQIFSALKQILVPRQDIVQKLQLNNVIHRARILAKETIPEHIQRYSRLEGRQLSILQKVKQCRQKLVKLSNDYEQYSNQRLSYQTFYKTYQEVASNFHKRKSSHLHINEMKIEPDSITIIEMAPPKPLEHAPRSSEINYNLQAEKQKKIAKLEQELYSMKKRQQKLISDQQQQIITKNKETNERIDKILRIFKLEKNPNQSIIESLREQILRRNRQYEELAQKNERNHKEVEKLQKQKNCLEEKNRIVELQLEKSRRGLQNQPNQFKKSTVSENNQDEQSANKKLEKRIKNLQYQNYLLTNELRKERETIYKMKKKTVDEHDRKIQSLEKSLLSKNKDLVDLKTEVDRCKIQNIRLQDLLRNSKKNAELAKYEAETSRNEQSHQSSLPGLIDSHPKVSNRFEESRLSKFYASQYNGDGNQYYPYFELLNKQFKIRFKRSCIKEKQLLHKSNGLQIGCISEYVYPNEIKVTLYFSNFSDQEKISNLKVKTTNTKNNKITFDRLQNQTIDIGKQTKAIVMVNIKNYPIGCTALQCSYDYYNKQEEVWVLLPVHVFKMLEFKGRDDEFREGKNCIIHIEKKIAKDQATLNGYFKGGKICQNKISSTIIHSHTETKLFCDISFQGNDLRIEYEHRAGEEHISEYIIKTLLFLLKREQKNHSI